MIYRNGFNGMDESTVAEYGADLPADKDGINAEGRTILQHNAHIRAARLARLVAYFASNADAPEAGEAGEHDAALTNARNAFASAEGEVCEAETAWYFTPETEKDAILQADASSNARPFPMGAVEDARAFLARAIGQEDAPAPAPVGAPLAICAAADTRAARAFRPHSCEMPRQAGETWRAFGARTKGCEGCADRREHATYGVRPALAPEAGATWEGLQGDRVASKGRAPAVGSNGIGARRMGRGTR